MISSYSNDGGPVVYAGFTTIGPNEGTVERYREMGAWAAEHTYEDGSMTSGIVAWDNTEAAHALRERFGTRTYERGDDGYSELIADA